MHYIYLIQSIPNPVQRYVGVTSDLKGRFKAHNEGRSPYTSKYKPWELVTYLTFSDDSKAVEFEKYLKSSRKFRADDHLLLHSGTRNRHWAPEAVH
jgi:predicted GIY-YIG superfamily endonuclease